MPGILPMKVIKIGNSAQSRIAQACDRCRSKKIRCDGVRPTCSQCSSVGFECRTSDKLSRRAFPRGYTESLEERVRLLEAEVRDLKDILDEKDEKIDILSAIYGGGDLGRASSVASARLASPSPPKDAPPSSKENTFRAQATQLLFGVENSDSYFMGPSSGRDFIASLKHKLRESGKPCGDFNPDAFLHIQGCAPLAPLDSAGSDEPPSPPPRLFTDKCVNVFFQEWAPLFPILHKPTLLRTYEEYVSDPERIKHDYKFVQLYLVFSIAGLSSPSPDLQQVANCKQQWIKALEPLLIENTMDTLQCLILAILYCAARADYRRLQLYKSMAVGLCHRLGLHQSQKRFSFGALTLETRKRVFWTLYTLDCFTAAIMGLPRLLKEEDVQAEYPSDSDDEGITEQGFQSPLADDNTPVAGALALFQASRILARVLEKNYPSSASYDLCLEQMGGLGRELDTWYSDLPPSLRLNFAQDKPSTDVTGSRSPLLALAYYYIRTLIYRPAVGSSLESRAAPALMSISDSSKHMIQISQLLEERSMSFSFCFNKGDMLAVCGLTLLYQIVDLWQDSKLRQESARLVYESLQGMRETRSPGFEDLDRVAKVLINTNLVMADEFGPVSTATQGRPRTSTSPASSCRSLPSSVLSHHGSSHSAEPQYQARADGASGFPQDQRMAKPRVENQVEGTHYYRPRHSLDAQLLAKGASLTDDRSSSPATGQPRPTPAASTKALQARPNLDYLELHNSQALHARPHSQLSSHVYSLSHPHSHSISHSRSRSRSGSFPHSHPHLLSNNAAARWSSMPVSSSTAATSSVSGPRSSSKSEGVSDSEWEALLGAMDGGSNNVYNAIYGGTGLLTKTTTASASASAKTATTKDGGWTRDSWDLSSFKVEDSATEAAPSHSMLSMSDESLSSEEEVTPPELGVGLENLDYQKQMSGFNLDDLFLL